MFSDRFALFLAVSALTKVVVYAGIGTIDCYGACDFRGARVGCLIFTLIVSVLAWIYARFEGESATVCVMVLPCGKHKQKHEAIRRVGEI